MLLSELLLQAKTSLCIVFNKKKKDVLFLSDQIRLYHQNISKSYFLLTANRIPLMSQLSWLKSLECICVICTISDRVLDF